MITLSFFVEWLFISLICLIGLSELGAKNWVIIVNQKEKNKYTNARQSYMIILLQVITPTNTVRVTPTWRNKMLPFYSSQAIHSAYPSAIIYLPQASKIISKLYSPLLYRITMLTGTMTLKYGKCLWCTINLASNISKITPNKNSKMQWSIKFQSSHSQPSPKYLLSFRSKIVHTRSPKSSNIVN